MAASASSSHMCDRCTTGLKKDLLGTIHSQQISVGPPLPGMSADQQAAQVAEEALSRTPVKCDGDDGPSVLYDGVNIVVYERDLDSEHVLQEGQAPVLPLQRIPLWITRVALMVVASVATFRQYLRDAAAQNLYPELVQRFFERFLIIAHDHDETIRLAPYLYLLFPLFQRKTRGGSWQNIPPPPLPATAPDVQRNVTVPKWKAVFSQRPEHFVTYTFDDPQALLDVLLTQRPGDSPWTIQDSQLLNTHQFLRLHPNICHPVYVMTWFADGHREYAVYDQAADSPWLRGFYAGVHAVVLSCPGQRSSEPASMWGLGLGGAWLGDPVEDHEDSRDSYVSNDSDKFVEHPDWHYESDSPPSYDKEY